MEADILEPDVDPTTQSKSVQLAKMLLKIDFDARDLERMDELAKKARAGTLTPQERQTAEDYNRAAHLLALLQSKARQSLKKRQL